MPLDVLHLTAVNITELQCVHERSDLLEHMRMHIYSGVSDSAHAYLTNAHVVIIYRKSGKFRVKNISCANISR